MRLEISPRSLSFRRCIRSRLLRYDVLLSFPSIWHIIIQNSFLSTSHSIFPWPQATNGDRPGPDSILSVTRYGQWRDDTFGGSRKARWGYFTLTLRIWGNWPSLRDVRLCADYKQFPIYRYILVYNYSLDRVGVTWRSLGGQKGTNNPASKPLLTQILPKGSTWRVHITVDEKCLSGTNSKRVVIVF